MRLIKYVKRSNLCNTEYITLGEVYELNTFNTRSANLRRHEPSNPCPPGTFMSTVKIKKLLAVGSLVFVD